MIVPPIVSSGFGWAVFLPMVLASVLGAVICVVGRALSTRVLVGQVTAELICDLASADEQRRELVLSELKETERRWFLSEINRIRSGTKFRQASATPRP